MHGHTHIKPELFIFENKYFILHKETVADIADKHTPRSGQNVELFQITSSRCVFFFTNWVFIFTVK
jgi:hypothetical protein